MSLFASLAVNSSQAADLIWEVESPFRFFKPTRSFALHEAAFNAVRGDPAAPLPTDIIWRTERRLNDPDCKDASHPDKCAATAGKRYEQSRLGWAAQTVGETCYDSNGRPRRYSAVCERKYSWGSAKEDYVLPEAHTVAIAIAPEQLADVAGDCIWSWQPRKAGGKAESKRLPCKSKLTIARVPYSLDRSNSGVSVTVKLPDGRELTEREVVVEDLFIVALGDSFASGESNPDRPVTFSAVREMVYDPTLVRDEVASRTPPKTEQQGFGLASAPDQFNPKVLPRRFMDDEAADRFHKLSSPEFVAAFEKASARWLSRDCHRSQYGYPFRVAIQLALENRHRSVTLASFTCSGAEVAEGLFGELDPREGSDKVRPQLDQLSELLCRGNRSQSASYTLPVFTPGSPSQRPAFHQDLVPAAAAQAADRRGADVDRRQRRRLRRARRLRADRGRLRPGADRRAGRAQGPFRPAGSSPCTTDPVAAVYLVQLVLLVHLGPSRKTQRRPADRGRVRSHPQAATLAWPKKKKKKKKKNKTKKDREKEREREREREREKETKR